LTIFRANDLKRSIGVADSALAGEPLASPLPADSVCFGRCAMLPGQLRVGQPLSGNRRYHFPKSITVYIIALIEPERLFVEIPAKVKRLYRDVGALDGPLQERPKVFDAIGVNFIAHIFRRRD
jgi:hypothetical protein